MGGGETINGIDQSSRDMIPSVPSVLESSKRVAMATDGGNSMSTTNPEDVAAVLLGGLANIDSDGDNNDDDTRDEEGILREEMVMESNSASEQMEDDEDADEDGNVDAEEYESDYSYAYDDEDDNQLTGCLITMEPFGNAGGGGIDADVFVAEDSIGGTVTVPETNPSEGGRKQKWREPTRAAVNMSLRAEKEKSGGRRRLASDLYKIMTADTYEAGFSLNPIDDDSMDNWCIKLFGFEEDSNLAKDLLVCGMDHVELEMSFPEQYPFEPPFVRVVKPRLERQTGFVYNGAICMELLTKDGWNPISDIEIVIASIRSLLVVGDGRLEAAVAMGKKDSTPKDDSKAGGEQDSSKSDSKPSTTKKRIVDYSYTVEEARSANDLIRAVFASLSLSHRTPLETPPPINSLKTPSCPSPHSLSSTKSGVGTGYGGANEDTEQLIAGQKKAEQASVEDDKANVRFLKKMLNILTSKIGSASKMCEGCNIIDGNDQRKLAAVLADIFRNQVPTDWDRRRAVYTHALDVSLALASDETLGSIFGDKHSPESVLYWLLEFSHQATDIVERPRPTWGWSREDQADMALATKVCEVAGAALKISLQCQAQKAIDKICSVTSSERYQSQLGPLRFDTVDTLQNHYFLKKIPAGSGTVNSRLLFKELTAYRTALPVEYGSSCFCRVMNSQLNMLRVMITGPDETPYANGCFLFDIYLPSQYPQVAPLVQFLTTGDGKIRFNPNLYECGRVCLSLLGTWDGPSWISNQSTLLQVLISIQSLIFVPDPYFNEPGYDSQRGTTTGDSWSNDYNTNIQSYTTSIAIESHLLALLGQHTNPYVEFETVMIKHFLEKRSMIQNELWSWVWNDPNLAPTVGNIYCLLEQLSDREREQQSKRAKQNGIEE